MMSRVQRTEVLRHILRHNTPVRSATRHFDQIETEWIRKQGSPTQKISRRPESNTFQNRIHDFRSCGHV